MVAATMQGKQAISKTTGIKAKPALHGADRAGSVVLGRSMVGKKTTTTIQITRNKAKI